MIARSAWCRAALCAVLLTACGKDQPPPPLEQLELKPMPAQIGDLRFQREPTVESRLSLAGSRSLLSGVQVYTARNGNNLLGYVELGEFKREFPASRPEVRQGVLDTLGGGKPQPRKLGQEVVFAKQGLEQRFLIWFSPGGRYFQVLVAGRKLADPERLFEAILAAQSGRPPVTGPAVTNRHDPRLGGSL